MEQYTLMMMKHIVMNIQRMVSVAVALMATLMGLSLVK